MPRRSCSRTYETLGGRGDGRRRLKGYLRNYLIPRKLAEPATKGSIAAAQRRQEAGREGTRGGHREGPRERRAAQQDGAHDHRTRPATTAASSARSPRRTSSTRSARPAASSIDKRKVHLDEPIKTVGTRMVVVEVADDVTATIKTMVVEEK